MNPTHTEGEELKRLLLGLGGTQVYGDQRRDVYCAIARVYQQPVASTLRRRFPSLSSQDLADIWQESLVALWEAVEAARLNTEGCLGEWLFTVARRSAIDVIRKRVPTTNHLSLDSILASSSHVPAASAAAEDADSVRRLRDVIAACPLNETESLVIRTRVSLAVHMPVIGSIPPSAIATAITNAGGTALTEAQVKTALFTARNKLDAHLARHGYYASRRKPDA